jgi:ELWxxDGT repeat protein
VLVKAINFGRPSGLWDFTVVNGILYFAANTSPWNHLWKSDGTESGTVGVKSFLSYRNPLELTNFNEVLYLRASHDSSVGDELFTSDGTDIGTVLVKDINTTGDASPQNLTVVGNLLYFSASDGINGEELWKSDGTESGTVMVKDINSGPGDAWIDQLTGVGSELYFIAENGVKGSELWVSNGSESGTSLVKDIVTGSEGSSLIELTDLGGNLVFSSDHQKHQGELWLSDGTAAGTDVVKSLYLYSEDSFFDEQAAAGGMLFFTTNDGVHGEELWKSDSTESGTQLVKDINPDDNWHIRDIESVNSFVFFSADDGVHGTELWKSDGTTAGTKMVKDIWPGSGTSFPYHLTNVEGTLFFTALRDDNVYGLWKSDGTEAGTVFIAEIDYEMEERTVFKGELYFRASGRFWKSDGTEGGTYMVKEITPYCLTGAGDYLYFASIYFGAGSEELWKSDGTEAGTSLVKDIVPGNLGGLPYPNEWCELEAVGDHLFFVAGYFGLDSHGGEVWKTDGTESGTVLVKDINPGSGDACSPGLGCNLTDVNGTLFFVPFKEELGRELWKSDGSASGTTLVKDINPGTSDGLCDRISSQRCSELINVNGTLHFDANEGLHGYELWLSDGTAPGTEMVQDIAPGMYPSGPNDFVLSGSYLYFTADDSVHGDELWALPTGAQTRVDIIGDPQGYTGVAYDFTAQVNPPGASTPVTYEWQATGKSGKTNTGGLSDTVSFSWNSPGSKTVSVTAGNGINSVTDEFVITISEPDVPLASLTISGAGQGQTGAEYNFSADASPLNATTPITYEWQATDQTGVTNTGGVSDSVAFTWNTTGKKTISVTASNKVNTVQAQFDIIIGEADIPMSNLTITVDQVGYVGGEWRFTATVDPPGATTPITYEWQATDQNEVINTGGLSDSVIFIWNEPGLKTVFVTARNSVNSLSEQGVIVITDVAKEIYLPVLLNK